MIGATNALPLIDPAISSRFDTIFEFMLPNEAERFSILELYASRLPLPIKVDLRSVAKMTNGLSGRDLRDRILKEALHIAISDGESTITRNIVMRILDKITIKNSPDYTI